MTEEEFIEYKANKKFKDHRMWMALGLHTALGYAYDPDLEFQGHDSWEDWWADMIADVALMAIDQDIGLDN